MISQEDLIEYQCKESALNWIGETIVALEMYIFLLVLQFPFDKLAHVLSLS